MASAAGAPAAAQTSSQITLTYGTIDIICLTFNLFSLLILTRKFTSFFSSEVFVLILSLCIASLLGCTLLTVKVFDLTKSSDIVGQFSLAVPILYNLFLPAILEKGACQLIPTRKSNSLCGYFYGGICLSTIIFVVLILSPMPGMDYHKFAQAPVHAPHPGLHTSLATPVMMIMGCIPQALSCILSLLVIYEISGNVIPYYGQTEHQLTNRYATYESVLLVKYLRRWGTLSVMFVAPSSALSLLGYFLWRTKQKLPIFLAFYHALCDSILYITQPLALIMLWLAYNVYLMNQRLELKQRRRLHLDHHVAVQNGGVFKPIPSYDQQQPPTVANPGPVVMEEPHIASHSASPVSPDNWIQSEV